MHSTSSRVQRDGVTAVVTKITTDNGLVGWGESCPGPNVESVYEAVKSTRSTVTVEPGVVVVDLGVAPAFCTKEVLLTLL